MKILSTMVVSIVVSLIILSSNATAEAPIYEQNIVEILTPQEYIVKYAEQFKTDPSVLFKIAKCESQLNPDAKGDWLNGIPLAKGLYQYHLGTWNGFVEIYKKEVYNENLDRNSYQDQIKLTAFIFAKYPGFRSRWTSYVAYANGGTYSFYSKLLGKHFTVICK